jgi:hypothetical protein
MASAPTGPVLRLLGDSPCIWQGAGISIVPCHVFLEPGRRPNCWHHNSQIKGIPGSHADSSRASHRQLLFYALAFYPFTVCPTNVVCMQCREDTVGKLCDKGGQLLQRLRIMSEFFFHLWYTMPRCWSKNQSSSALMEPSYIATLEASCRTLKAWSCRPVKRCTAYMCGVHLHCSTMATIFS